MTNLSKVNSLPYIKPSEPMWKYTPEMWIDKLRLTRQALTSIRIWLEDEGLEMEYSSPDLYKDLVEFEIELLLIIRELEGYLNPSLWTKMKLFLLGFFR